MEVIYRSVIDEICEIRMRADLANRTITHIKLTKGEYNEIKAELFDFMARGIQDFRADTDILGMVNGVTLIKGWS